MLILPTTNRGLGLFADQPLFKGQVICLAFGPYIPGGPKFQVGPNEYIGPSHGLADAINHSCSPNVWVKIDKGYPVLALRDINAGEEITLDYSCTATDDRNLACKCGEPNCRGDIRNFKSIPTWQQEWYIEQGVVPGYVLDTLLPALGRPMHTSPWLR